MRLEDGYPLKLEDGYPLKLEDGYPLKLVTKRALRNILDEPCLHEKTLRTPGDCCNFFDIGFLATMTDGSSKRKYHIIQVIIKACFELSNNLTVEQMLQTNTNLTFIYIVHL